MDEQQTDVVTGAFGYSGQYIARKLLARGHRVVTLTNSPGRTHSFGGSDVTAMPFHFDQPERLAGNLAGARVLYNTYWVRFNHRLFTHSDAVHNTEVLFEAARCAGVERIVHVSITNPSEVSPFEYFRGKARLERALQATGISHTILRPAVLFGGEDILINNIAWMLRKMPVFGVFGDGQYRLQPIHVDDFAELAVAQGQSRENAVIDAIGPETFTYRELVERIAEIIGVRARMISVSPWFGLAVARLVGWLTGDVIITREEIGGLMADLLCTDSPPAGTTSLSDWARENASQLGRVYHSELRRRKDRSVGY